MEEKRMRLTPVLEADEDQDQTSQGSEDDGRRRRPVVNVRHLEDQTITFHHPSDKTVQDSQKDEAELKAHLDSFMKPPQSSGAASAELLNWQKRASSPWRKIKFDDDRDGNEHGSQPEDVAGPSCVMQMDTDASDPDQDIHLYNRGREEAGKLGPVAIQTLKAAMEPRVWVMPAGDDGQASGAEEEPQAAEGCEAGAAQNPVGALQRGDLPSGSAESGGLSEGAKGGVGTAMKDEPMEIEHTGVEPPKPQTSSKSGDSKSAGPSQKRGQDARGKPKSPGKGKSSPAKPPRGQTPKQKTLVKSKAAASPASSSSASAVQTSHASPKVSKSPATSSGKSSKSGSGASPKVVKIREVTASSRMSTVIPGRQETNPSGDKATASSIPAGDKPEESGMGSKTESLEEGVGGQEHSAPSLGKAESLQVGGSCQGLDELGASISGSSIAASSTALSDTSGASVMALMGDIPGSSMADTPGSGRVNPVGKSQSEEVALEPDYETDKEPLRVNGTTTIADQLARWAALDDGVRVHAFSFLNPRPPTRAQERGPMALTTSELLTMAKRYAHVLNDRYGVRLGTVVCSLLPPSPERLVLDMAIILCGGVVLCVDCDPRPNETKDQYYDRVSHALTLSTCRLVFCASQSPFLATCTRNKVDKKPNYQTLDVVILSYRDWESSNKGFLHGLFVMEDACQFVEPDLRADHPAAIFLDLDNEGQDILVFYQHQAILQLGAQMTQVLQLDRRRDVLFNPCPPSQPWGFPAAFLYSGVHTVTFDLMPCQDTLGLPDDDELAERQGWPWTMLPHLDVNVALLLPPTLNIFHDFFIAEGQSYQTSMLNKASLKFMQRPYMRFSRVAIGGMPMEMEAGLRMLKRFEIDVIKVMVVNVCLGIMTSERVGARQREIPLSLRREPVGRCLTHLQMAMEDPDDPDHPVLKLEQYGKVKVGNIVVRCRYNMPCPVRKYNGTFDSLVPNKWTRLHLVGFLDHEAKLHVIGSVRPVVTVYHDGRKQWNWVDVRSLSVFLRSSHKEIMDAQVVHILAQDHELPTRYSAGFFATVHTHEKECDGIYEDHINMVKVELCDPFGEVTQFLTINQFPIKRSGGLNRSKLMALAWEARTEGQAKIFVEDRPDDDGDSPSEKSPKTKRGTLASLFSCFYSPSKL